MCGAAKTFSFCSTPQRPSKLPPVPRRPVAVPRRPAAVPRRPAAVPQEGVQCVDPLFGGTVDLLGAAEAWSGVRSSSPANHPHRPHLQTLCLLLWPVASCLDVPHPLFCNNMCKIDVVIII